MLEEIKDETACDVIASLSITRLRQSEARGLRWTDWNEDEQTLSIARSVWRKHVGPTKNPASEDSIPVLPPLRDLLTTRRERIKPAPSDYIFAGVRRGAPLDFHNLVNRVIKPTLKNVSVIKWHGLHGFRCGLASNLFAMGANPKVIAAIMRHQSISITLQHYIKTPDAESRAAMEKLEAKIRNRPSGVIVGS
jgi:integrase